ncbi:MAG: glycerophosphodiester phosphodiesterase [Aureispira sp.]|nr:glycerophosphodiester phosphodiesterase [Aureispira sp.]
MNYHCTLLLLILCLCSCNKKDLAPNNTSKTIGHGGMGFSHALPINCSEAISKCLSIGADGVEIDIQLSKDSTWVAFHDIDLEHSTNLNGLVSKENWSYIQNGYYHNPIYASYSLIKIDDLLKNLENKREHILAFDLKNFNPDSDNTYLQLLARKYVELIHEYQIEDNSYLVASTIELLELIHSIDSNLNLFIYSGENFDQSLQQAIDKEFDGIAINLKYLSKDLVTKAHSVGIKVATFGITTPKQNKVAVDYNVDYIETDQVSHLVNLLDTQ